ncbi:hypothetical protein ABPG77_003490 [Micractinium sp. CCAP 211/92]
MSPGSAGSPSVTAGGIASGVQHGGQEGDGEQGSGSGGRQTQPAAAGNAKPVVRSREHFMRVWKRFMLSRNLDPTPPLFHRATMDLFKLFRTVYKLGGHDEVVRQKGWARVGRMFNPPSSMTDLSFQTKRIYATKLLEFEQASRAYRAGDIAAEIALEGPAASPEAGASAAAAKKPRPSPKPLPKPARSAPTGSTAVSPTGAASEGRQTQHQQRQLEGAETEAAAVSTAVAAAAVAAATESEGLQQAGQDSQHKLLPEAMQLQQGQLKQEAVPGLPGLAGEAALLLTSPRQLPRPPSRPSSRARPRSRASGGPRPARPAGSARTASSLKAAQGVDAAEPVAGGEAAMEVEQMPPALPAFLPSLSLPSAAVAEGSQQTVGAGAGEATAGGPFARPPSSQRPRRAARAVRMRTTQPEGAGSAEAMLGRRIGIWWDNDAVFYYGSITAYDPLTQMHTVLYDDGDEEELALAFEHWVFADGRQQGRPAPQPLALMGSWDLGPAEEGQLAQQGQPPKRARIEELQGGSAGGAASAPQAALLGQGPGGPASQQPGPDPAQPAAGLSSGLPPAAAPPSGRAATPQLPSDFLLFPATPAAPVQLPPRLVATGRNYRVFTSGAQPGGFELFMLLPGLSIEEVSVRCWSSGLMLIKAEPRLPRQPSAAVELAPGAAAAGGLGGGGAGAEAPTTPGPTRLPAAPATPAAVSPSPESVQIQLPSRVDAHSATAQFTAVGQLYVRINVQE